MKRRTVKGTTTMEMLQLRYFYHSAKHESFAKTAEKYMVPISSVSASIKRLEKEIGCTLFDRESNRISLNENGKILQNSLYIAFGELDRALERLSPKEPDRREIKLSVRAMRNEITDYIIEYKSKNPDINFKTFFDFGDAHFENYDIIIDDKPERYPDYESFELCSRLICLVAAKGSSLCGKKLRLGDLCNMPFLSFGEHTSSHRMFTSACKKEGFTPNFVVHTNDLQCYLKYLRAGIGIGIRRYDEKNLLYKDTEILNVVDFRARQTVYVFYKSSAAYGNIKAFIDFLHGKASN